MYTLPRSRKWLLPALVLLIFVLFYRSIVRVPASVKTIVHFRPQPSIHHGVEIPSELVEEHFLPVQDRSEGHLWPEQKYYYSYTSQTSQQADFSARYLEPLVRCPLKPNPHTNHVRLGKVVQNVSQATTPDDAAGSTQKFNPTIIALPPWSPHQYLLVSRVVTEGLHQESLLCEADTCYSGVADGLGPRRRPGEKDCTQDDVRIVGAAGGLRCASKPKIISIPPTPAEQCEGTWSSFPNIPGFHDPRIFWSGKGEPLIMVNSASRYACVGLWIADLRTLHQGLSEMLQSQPGRSYHPGPLMSYPSLTELTRNPASTRASVEKNWFLFFPTPDEAFLHYDLSLPRAASSGDNKTTAGGAGGGRTFAKVIGNGFTTPNLTDPGESPCLLDEPDPRGKFGHWHQTSNSLKLVLCRREEAERGECSEGEEGRAVHFAVMHRKFSNEWDLPLRYERFFVVWDARPPFRMLGMTRYPVLMWNETASGWSGEENWDEAGEGEEEEEEENDDDDDDAAPEPDGSPSARRDGAQGSAEITSYDDDSKHNNDYISSSSSGRNFTRRTRNSNNTTASQPPNQNWAYFTYTPSIAWAWRPSPSIPVRGEPEKPESGDDGGEDGSAGVDDDKGHARTLEALNVGYLDDEVILGIGVDDRGQGFATVRAEHLLACLRRCP